MATLSIDPQLVLFAATVFTVATLGYLAASHGLRRIGMIRQGSGASDRRHAPSSPLRAQPDIFRAANPPSAASIVGSDMRLSRAENSGAVGMANQIERLAGYVADQSDRTAEAMRLHGSAGQQIDLASYAIQTLVKELGNIVPSLAPVSAPTVRGPSAEDVRRLSLAA